MLKLAPRLYQQTILGSCISKNTMVVLPTGLGKTMVAMMTAVVRRKENPGSKVLFVSPTRPLVEQHARTFSEGLEEPGEIAVFTGSVPAAKRQKLWESADYIFSTPQGLENDVMARRISLKEVSLFVVDEAHRATGDYAYVFLAQRYKAQSRNERILALTASPGAKLDQIMEVVENLHIEEIEIRTPEDPDVAPYVQDVELSWIPVKFPDEFNSILRYLKDCHRSKLELIKEYGYISRIQMNKMELLKLQGQLHGRMASGERDFEILKSISLLAEAMKVEHAIELLESQGLFQCREYMEKLERESLTSKTKAVKNLVKDLNFRSALIGCRKLSIAEAAHPKLTKLKEMISDIVVEDTTKVIVFTQYRTSAERIKEILDPLEHVQSEIFVGQAKKRGKGMSQKEQIALLDKFRNGEFNVLIATSVAEEGLDIPKVDEVIFYEPIPSAIRSIQRRGRTGRSAKGAVKVLMTKGTRDEAYRWSAHHKEKAMYKHLKNLGNRMKEKLAQKPKEQNTLNQYVESDIAMYVDHREKGSQVMKNLINSGVQLTSHQLPIGDYQLSTRVCVEFKTVEDFVNSIVDGRLFEQLVNMKKHFSKPLLIIQGKEDMYSIRKIHPNAIRGALGTIATKICIPVLQTRDANETSELLLSIAKKEQDEVGHEFKPHGNKRPITTSEIQEHIVSSLPGVGYSLAKPLLEKFKNVKSIVNASEEELREIELIGEKKAKAILEALEKEYSGNKL